MPGIFSPRSNKEASVAESMWVRGKKGEKSNIVVSCAQVRYD